MSAGRAALLADQARVAGFTQCKAGKSDLLNRVENIMITQITDNVGNGGTAIEADVHVNKEPAAKCKPRAAIKPKSAGSGKKAAPTSKKDQLVALLSKPNGARISVIAERLGWQTHTVRAALSGLRKQGVEVAASKSPKTGETVYAIVAPPVGEGKQSGDGAAS